MTSTILVPVDGSDKDARALAVAADLAQLADASLLLVRVRNPRTDSAPHEPESAMLDAMRASAEVPGMGVAKLAGRPAERPSAVAARIGTRRQSQVDQRVPHGG